MKRRELLGFAALAASGLPGCLAPKSAARVRKKVVILGAGIAGLVAGYELVSAGNDVVLLEARARPGGRVQTLREPFFDGQHADAGALFVPNYHELSLRYAGFFGLQLEPATPLFEARLLYARGRHLVTNWGGTVAWPFDLTPEERTLGLRGMWKRYIGEAVAGAHDVAAQEAYDRMSALEFLRSRGASSEAIALLRIGHLDMMGDGIESYSALHMLRRLGLQEVLEPAIYTIRGGSDLLPKAFAEKLADRIRYESPVVRIEPGERSVRVVVAWNGGEQELSADHVICTLPFSVLRRIEVSPPFSAQKRRAIEDLPYTSVARVFLQLRRKVWTAENLYLQSTTDLPMKWVFDHTINQPGRRGILEAQAFGADARRLSRMSETERIEFALAQLEPMFPGMRSEYERGTTKCWDDDPWARGAFSYFRPGQVMSLTPHLARPEGRVHFAGDHTSVWSGWMQGALESGIRAAREVRSAI